MKINKIVCLLGIVGILAGCEKEEEPDPIIKESISGYVQKGPFINGASILISELDKKLNATGRNFTTQISDNRGSFEFNNVQLKSQFVSLKADGFYFNEVRGQSSSAPLTLYALTDLKDISTINVNVLSYLEKARIEYLISEGEDFASAKKQAQKEVLAVFEIEKADINNSESLDISGAGEDNAILLAVSTILQANRSVAELSEMMANIISDMKEDGTLDNPEYGSELLKGVKNIDLAKVRTNVEERYASLGQSGTIADFEKYVEDFEKNTEFIYVSEFSYPEHIDVFGQNLLYGENDFIIDTRFRTLCSFAAFVPDKTSLRVVIKDIEGEMYIHWDNKDWEINGSYQEGFIEAKSTRSGELLNTGLYLSQKGSCLIEIYEGYNMEPSITKTLYWEPVYTFSYPEEGQYGINLLAPPYLPEPDTHIEPGEYSLAVSLPDDKDYELEISISEVTEWWFSFDPEKMQNWEYTLEHNNLILRCSGKGITADMAVTLKSYGDIQISCQSSSCQNEIEKHISWR